MADRLVKVSDLSGEIIEEDQELAHLIVESHPEFSESSPITLDVKPEEVEGEIPEDGDLVVLAYLAPGQSQAHRFFMERTDFDKLAAEGDMVSILSSARAAQTAEQTGRRGRRRQARQATEKVDYSSPEHAGEPHRGRAMDAEKEYVRLHLSEVNQRLARDDRRQIDPNDPKMAERYGLSPKESTTASQSS